MATLHKDYPSPLPDPFRLHILKRITETLSDITPANGYKFDLTDSVFRGRALFGEDDPVPLVSILEVPIPLDQSPSSGTNSKGGWELMVQGFAADDRTHPTDPAQVLMADIKQCLAREKTKIDWDVPAQGIFGLGGMVDKLYIGTGVVRPADEISAKGYFWLTIVLDIVEDLADPYNAPN